ncbi:class I SAM-dependent methyltransferase [Myxococcus llanfairpwllgwyngyllgogerychwyrndrobwllllantysiliogogogochensis]|uniref:Class I SAM-dependent methyltransferase n=1 Tax=Myxococcus llanfairpwllgwyngyllgogerychwyrndrobwllllantysiliogogogochensis TaxID=2590453 RepID=A0A540WLM1_9BACT|nr:class I SAM-dependent methyltransferase [Myxococcus llanfairpwllgwyngyllgogerychwyrndrobwllllantysiliogogogochensis]
MGEKARQKRLARERAEAIAYAQTVQGLAFERERYAKAWSQTDAASFARGGHYAWMASFVAGHARVLEVGTGSGSGTIELLRAGHVVVSIDENPECLAIAQKRISEAGYASIIERRETVRQVDGGHEITYGPPRTSIPTLGALLLEGDSLNDPLLCSWLQAQPQFDAVVCWLMGSHRARSFNAALGKWPAGEYRLHTQNRLYALSDSILRSGGILQIVDRAEMGASKEEEELFSRDWRSSHEEQARAFSTLRVEPVPPARPYDLPAKSGVQMGMTLPLSGRVPSNDRSGLVSVIARKP